MSPAKRTVMCMFSASIHFAPLSGARSSDRRSRIASGISMAVNSRGMLSPCAGRLLGAGALDQLLDGRQDLLRYLGHAPAVGMEAVIEISICN